MNSDCIAYARHVHNRLREEMLPQLEKYERRNRSRLQPPGHEQNLLVLELEAARAKATMSATEFQGCPDRRGKGGRKKKDQR